MKTEHLWYSYKTQCTNQFIHIDKAKVRLKLKYWRGEELVERVKVKVKSLSHVRLFATPWTVAYQAPPSMGFSRQEYWSGLPFPSSRDLPDPGIKLGSPAFQVDALTSEPPGKPKD